MTTRLSYNDALDYIYSFTDYGSLRTYRYTPETFDLGRMRALMARLGNPQDRHPTIHVAGTKGKGSTSAMIASALRAAGYKTGFYVSPHLQDFNERIQISGELIPPARLAELVAEVQPHVAAVPGITTFEIVTAVAFMHFAHEQVDAAVVEVGLGGRLDATNVLSPLVSVITSLSYDHTHLLGTTLAEIAFEKAGIVKPNIPVVTAPQLGEALEVVERVCAERQAPLTIVGRDWLFSEVSRSLEGQSLYIWSAVEQRAVDQFFDEEGAVVEWVPPKFRIPLLGHHQVVNATVAFAALKEASGRGLHVSEDEIRRGFSEVRWPGRFEVLSGKPALVVDSAHNRDSAQKLRTAIDDYFPGRGVIFIFGASTDKDVAGMFDELLPRVKRAIMVQAVHPRAADPEELVSMARMRGCLAVAVPQVRDALQMALEIAQSEDIILTTGSLFVVAEVSAAWQEARRTPAAHWDHAKHA